MKQIHLFYLILCLCFTEAKAQTKLSLHDCIGTAQQQSMALLRSNNEVQAAQLDASIVQAQLKPQLGMTVNMPNYFNTSQAVTQPNGGVSFQNVSQNNGFVGFNASQQLLKTNTTLFAQSNLLRFDDFAEEVTNYNSVPIRLGIQQPINQFNALKWNKAITEKQMQVVQKQNKAQQQSNRVDVTLAFFTLLSAQTDVNIAQSNLENSQEVLRIAEERYKLGKISYDDVLQIKLSVNTTKKNLSAAQRDVIQQVYLLQQHMNDFELPDDLELLIPDQLPQQAISEQKAAHLAWENNATEDALQLQLLRANRNQDRANKTNGFQATIDASIGLVRSAQNLTEVYQKPQDETFLNVGLSIPIFDGKFRKKSMQRAELDQQLAKQEIQFNEQNSKQQVAQLARQVNLLKDELTLSYENYNIAQERYEIANKRYALGDINNTDLNLAYSERDYSLRAYIATLQQFWVNYYLVQQLTLYDFEQNKPL